MSFRPDRESWAEYVARVERERFAGYEPKKKRARVRKRAGQGVRPSSFKEDT